MKHIEFDDLYHLADLTIEDAPLDDYLIEQMHHLAECKACYDEFCSIIAILETTNETGMMVVRQILSNRIKSSEENIVQKVLAVISVKTKRIKEQINVVMEQLQNDVSSLCFEARNAESNMTPKISRLEDVENEKTFIVFDSKLRNLYIQIDVRNLTSDKLSAYLAFSDEEKKMIPLSRDGYLLKGKINNITNADFEIFIVQ